MDYKVGTKFYEIHFVGGEVIQFETLLNLKKVIEKGKVKTLIDVHNDTTIQLSNIAHFEHLGTVKQVTA